MRCSDGWSALKVHKRRKDTGFAWMELLVIAGIVLLVVSLFIRVRYGRAWLAAEYSFVESVGINPSVYNAAKIALLFIALLCYAIYRLARAGRHY
jgi:hypothetical protein